MGNVISRQNIKGQFCWMEQRNVSEGEDLWNSHSSLHAVRESESPCFDVATFILLLKTSPLFSVEDLRRAGNYNHLLKHTQS